MRVDTRWLCGLYERNRRAAALLLILTASLVFAGIALAEPPRVLPEGKIPADRRLQPLKDLNGYFPFDVPKTKEAWTERAEQVRRRMLVANGLWPVPTKTPANAVVHGLVDRGEYTVERVFFESFPGHFVSGSLYKPKGKTSGCPAVLCPHGHWPNGRFHDHGEVAVKKELFTGAERFAGSGRYPLQARCVQLARMGCVVFHYDMLGYADSQQLGFELTHRFAKQRPEFDLPERWGLFGTQAELRLQSVMGIQTYNSLRAIDWICTLPEVDTKRIAVTGASGGGTQTFIISAIDPRVTVSFPAVMVSTAMQGGCTCENCSLLRIGTGNIEIAGLFAPRPLGMTAADDWTREIVTKGLPELKQLYALLGAPDNVMAAPLVQFPHNYNYVSRGAMFTWLNKHLKLGFEDPIVAEDFQPLTKEELTVWNEKYPQPPGGAEYEASLTKAMAEDSDQQIAALAPRDAASLAKYREVVGRAFDTLIDRGVAPAGAIAREKIDKQDKGAYWLFKDLLRYAQHGEELPVIFLHPKEWKGRVVIWIDGDGKSGLFGSDGSPRPAIAKLLAGGVAVASADLFQQGEFRADGKSLTETPIVNNPREAAAYTHGYNHSLFAQRVHDILTLVSFVKHDEHKLESVSLVGVHGAAPWVAAAAVQAGDAIDGVALETGGFRFQSLKSFRDVNFLPGALKYGDLPSLLALLAPHPLWLASEAEVPPLVGQAYTTTGKSAVTVSTANGEKVAEEAAAWLLK